MDSEHSFERLVGEPLNIVSFVMDYVEFHFNGPRIRALTNARVRIDGRDHEFPDAGSRDALCSLIGEEVREIQLKDSQHLKLTFASGKRLLIPLDNDSYIGPEALHWHPDDKPENMTIW